MNLLLPRLGRNSRKGVEIEWLVVDNDLFGPVEFAASAQPGKQQIFPKSMHFYASTQIMT